MNNASFNSRIYICILFMLLISIVSQMSYKSIHKNKIFRKIRNLSFKTRKLYSGNDQTDCQTAILNNMNTLKVWKHWMGEDIQYKLGDYGATSFIHSYQTGVQSNPHTVHHSNGGAVVVWTSNNQVTTTSLEDIYGCILDSTGVKVLCDFLINQSTTGTQTRPRLATLSDGFIVVWESNHTGSYNIYARIYNQAGSPLTSEFRVNSNTGRSHQYPDVNKLVSSGTNNIIVFVWQSDIRNGAVNSNDFDIYFRIFNDNTAAGSDTIVNVTLSNMQQNARIAGLLNGNFAVTWQSYSTSTLDDVYFRIFDSTGTEVVTETIINTFTSFTQRNPNIAGLLNQFVVSWTTNHTAGGTAWRAFRRTFSNEGVSTGVEVAMNPYSSNPQEATNISVYRLNYKNYSNSYQEGCSTTTPGCNRCNFPTENTLPACISGTKLFVSFGTNGNPFNLSSTAMYDQEDSFSLLKIKIYAISSTFGTLKINGVALTSGSQICSPSEITYDSPATTPASTSTNISFQPVDLLNSIGNLCSITLEICYLSCASCTMVGTSTSHWCSTCKSGYFPYATNTAFCYNSSTKPSDYYFNSSDNKYYSCYYGCGTCTVGGTATTMNCLTCATSFFPVDQTTNCAGQYSPPTGYYFDSTLQKHIYNNPPTCQSFSVSGFTSQNFYIDFTGKISDVEDTFSEIMIVSKALPTSGSIKCSGGTFSVGIGCNNQYVNYTPPATVGTYTFSYRPEDRKFSSTYNLRSQSAADCIVTLNITVPPVCYTSCQTCNATGTSTDHKCKTCKTSYYPLSDDNSQCFTTTAAPTKYWFSTNQFRPCYSSCDTCSSDGTLTTHNCLSCTSGNYFIIATTNCVNSSPTNYYFNAGVSKYKPCFTSCDTCSADGDSTNNSCLTCKTGYFALSDNTSNCLNVTPQFYYLNPSTQKYTPCYNSCSSCTAEGTSTDHKCSSCKTNYYQQQTTYNCYVHNATVTGFYFDSQSSLFKACESSCSACSSPILCSACNTGYAINLSTNFCDACYNSCSTCSARGLITDHKCDTCKTNYYLQHNTKNCFQSTDTVSGHFYDTTASKFMPCSTNCSACSASGCSLCLNGFTVDTSTSTCTSCYESCGTCSGIGKSDDHKCLTCKNTLYLKELTNNCHIQSTPISGYYYSSSLTMFKVCPSTCSECSSETKCTFCKDGYFLNTTTNFCDSCYNSCLTCTALGNTSDHKCTNCKTNYFLKDLTFSCYLSSDTISQYFYDTTLNKFKQCSSNCAVCSSTSACDTCMAGYVLKSDKSCYMGPTPSVPGCYSSCGSCSAFGTVDDHKCNTCRGLYFYKENTKNCYEETSFIQGYYLDLTQKIFTKCPDYCSFCKNKTTCDTCLTTHQLNPLTKQCERICYSSCKSCNELGSQTIHKCLICKDDYYFQDQTKNCLPSNQYLYGYYLNKVSKIFIKCPENCAACGDSVTNSKTNCITCADGFYFDENRTCFPCYSSCKYCTGLGNPEDHKCLSCKKGTDIKINSNCYDFPQNFYYLNSLTKTYYQCETLCEGCQADIEKYCSTCKLNNDVMFSSSCISKCPADYKPDNVNICRPCKFFNQLILNGTCLDKCPEKYIKFNDKCLEKCPKDYYLLEGSCVDNCPEKYIADKTFMDCLPPIIVEEKVNQIFTKELDIPLTDKAISQLSHSVIISNSTITTDLVDKIFTIFEKQSNMSLNDERGNTDNATLRETGIGIIELADLALYLETEKYKISDFENLSSSMLANPQDQNLPNSTNINTLNPINSPDVNQTQNKINYVKEKLTNIVENMISKSNETSDLNITVKATIIAVKIAPSKFVSNENFEEFNLSNVNYTICEEKIKKENGLLQSDSLIVKKFDYNPKTNLQESLTSSLVSDSVILDFYDPYTKNKLDASICNELPVKYSIPIKLMSKIRSVNAKSLMKSGIDIFNDNSMPFTSRCFRMLDENTNADTTINWRRKNYYDGQVNCSNQCRYNGVSNYKSINCECRGLQRSETYHTILNRTLNVYSNVNIDIFSCWREAFKTPDIQYNLAFYISIGLFSVCILCSFLFRGIYVYFVNKKLKDVIRVDCLIFNRQQYDIQQYFLKSDQYKSNENNLPTGKFEKIRPTTLNINNYVSNKNLKIDEHILSPQNKLEKDIESVNGEFTIISPKKVNSHKPINHDELDKNGNNQSFFIESYMDSHNEQNLDANNLSKNDEGQVSDRVYHLNVGPQVNDISKITANTNMSPSIRPFIKNTKNTGLVLKDDVEFEIKEVVEGREALSQKNSNNISLVSDNFNIAKTKIDSKKILKESSSDVIEINYSKSQDDITLSDYTELSAKESSIYDKRGFCRLLADSILLKHKILNLFFKFSLLDPLWKRIIVLFSFINFVFSFNAFFFTDDLIDYRANYSQSIRNSYNFVITQEWPKIIYSLLFANLFLNILHLMRYVPIESRKPFNDALKSKYRASILEEYSELSNRMTKRNIIFISFSIFLNLLCCYYNIVFCWVYETTSIGWVNASILTLIFDFGIYTFIESLLKVLLYSLVKKFPCMSLLLCYPYLRLFLNYNIK